MADSAQIALTINELEHGEFHFVILEAVPTPGEGEVLTYRPREVSERGEDSALKAWFAGLGAIRRILEK